MYTMLKKILFGNFITTFSIVLILFINIVLLFFPLTNVFGFEFSFINAIIISFLSGLFLISFLKKASNYSSIKPIILIGIIFLFIPLVISLTHSLLGMSCSIKDGFLFYLVLTFPSYIIGVSLGLIAFSISKRFSVLVYIFLFLLILLIPLFEFYFNPQIYFFNPIFGLLPGTIFDEGLSVSLKLVLYRFCNTVFFLIIFLFLYKYLLKNRSLVKKNIVIVLAFIISLVFILVSPFLGFSTTKQSLSKYLNKKVVTKHFIIHYPSKIRKSEIDILVLHHEYYYSRLSKYFNVKLDKKIESFVFNNNSEKGNLFGSANADVAKPWLYQIYTTQDSYNKTLEHEIAHVVSASFGKTIFKIADGINPTLIEGVAVAGSPFYDGYSIDYMTSLAWQNGYKINISKLFKGLSFFSQTSSLSYIYAGSFSKYLIDNYGISKYKLFYKNSEFKKIYHSSIDEITNKYYNYLDAIDTKGDSAKAKYYFGRRTIFTKVCPRYVSDRLKIAANEYNKHNFKKSLITYTDILNKTNNYYAVIGYADAADKMNKTEKGVNEIESKLKYFENTAYYYNLQFKLADLYFLNNKTINADSLYNKIINERSNLWLESITALRLYLLKTPEQLRIYLEGSPTDKLVLLLKLINNKNADIILPVALRLSKMTNLAYDLFIKNFLSDDLIKNLKDSYTLNMIAIYMLNNLDFVNSITMIEKANKENVIDCQAEMIERNLHKIKWISKHYKSILKKANI